MRSRLQCLLANVELSVEAEHTLQIGEIIDANEVGLALECTAGYLAEGDQRVSSDVLAEIDDLAHVMASSTP